MNSNLNCLQVHLVRGLLGKFLRHPLTPRGQKSRTSSLQTSTAAPHLKPSTQYLEPSGPNGSEFIMTYFKFKLCHTDPSTCSLAKNLLRALMLRAGSDPPQLHGDQDHHPSSEDILGRCYERRTRIRQPIKSRPLKQREGGIFAIYSALNCPDLEEPTEVHLISVKSYQRLNL